MLQSKDEISNSIKLINQSLGKNKVPSKICFLGYPHFFQSSYSKLKEEGHDISLVFPPKSDGHISDYLLNSRIFRKIYEFFYDVKHPYKLIKYEKNNNSLINHLNSEKYDYGFHKMNSIIPQEIFNCFKYGLLNDHWSLLPFIRGRSSIEYSLVLDIPLYVTVHKVVTKMDAGSIVCIFNYDDLRFQYSSVKRIKNSIRNDLPNRIVKVCQSYGRPNFPTFRNINSLGKNYYQIHPLLTQYINLKILRKS